ncbi:MAG: Gfo/Idh/MocA family oxidoreductase [bacterium]
MNAPLRYGVLGCGHLGSFHAEKAAQIPELELVGVFDIVLERAAAVAEKVHCPVCDTVEEFLQLCDALSIVVPTEDHFVEAERALLAGKHLLLEKPIATSVAEGEQLTALAEQQGVVLQIGHIERFNPACAALQLLPDKPRFIEAHRLSQFNPRGLDVAVIFDLMIHDIDLVLSLVKSEIKELHASAVAVISDKPDIANARLEFANGSVANLTASRISVQKMRKLRLFARDNYVSIDFLKRTSEHFRLAASGDHSTPPGYLNLAEYEPTQRRILVAQQSYAEVDMLTEEIKAFVSAVRGERPPAVSGAEATRALAIAVEIDRVAREGLARVLH